MDVAKVLFGLLVVLSVFAIIPEPMYHRKRVNFWEWLRRELIEEKTGFERDPL